MIRRPPKSTRTDTLFPYTSLFRSLDGDQRVGQLVADGLEPADRLAELDALERVLAGQLEHAARGADQLVAERDLRGGDRLVPAAHRLARAGIHAGDLAGDLNQADPRIEPNTEKRREGKERVSTCIFWCLPYQSKTKSTKPNQPSKQNRK